MNKRYGFWIALVIPILVLCLFLIEPILAFFFGTEIYLQSKSKNDFYFDGSNNLQIELIESQLLRPEMIDELYKNPEQPIEVYVSLKQEGNVHVVESVSKEKPKQGIYLKGALSRHYDWVTSTYRVTYNIEKPYLIDPLYPEGGTMVFRYKVYNGYGLFLGPAD